MTKAKKFLLLPLAKLLIFTLPVLAEPLDHPVIFSTDSERLATLAKIEKYDWAKNVFSHLKQTVDAQVNAHSKNPQTIFTLMPEFAKNDHQYTDAQALIPAKAHQQMVAPARNAAILYFLTGETKYAQFSADILQAYFEHIAPLAPETTTIIGNAFYDGRATYESLALAYDFIYDYLNTPGTRVFSKQQQTQIPFDNALAQKAIVNMVGNILQEYGPADKHGQVVSNHPILTATGALFGILCIDDETERERLFNVFWETGTKHQNSFTKTIMPMFGEQGIWPESLSYSFMPIISQIINHVDRIKPELNVAQDYKHVLEGNFLFDYLRAPNRVFVRYGDSKRYNDSTEALYRYTWDIADRRGYSDLVKKAQIALQQARDAKGGKLPRYTDGTFNNMDALDLFWGRPLPKTIKGAIDFNKPTVIIKHAGVALQRNYVDTNNVDYGLTGIIGGAHYVHSHATGISMELYGAGYFMAANAGMPQDLADRKGPAHGEYFRLYAGNNTVIVNGTSHGMQENAWVNDSHLWQDTTKNIAAEPAHLKDPISPNYSFATQRLDDTVNNATQERTLAIVRTSPTTAYYFDMFRSRSLDENKFHDYIYHNIGDETSIATVAGKLALSPTTRYDNDIGDFVKSPGWRFFEQEQTTAPTLEAVNIQFKLKDSQRSMNMFVPAGVEREYTHALAPATREAEQGYLKKKTQTIAIRQQGEAWKRPFIAVFEPSTSYKPSVTSVTQLEQNGQAVGVKVVSTINGKPVINYIICQDDPTSSYTDPHSALNFTGRFAVVTDRGDKHIELYIGEGSQLNYKSYQLNVKPGTYSAVNTWRK